LVLAIPRVAVLSLAVAYNLVMERLQARKKFAERLKELMIERNLNNSTLERASGIPNNTISDWLTLKRTPLLDSLHILADFFGCTIDYLTGREN